MTANRQNPDWASMTWPEIKQRLDDGMDAALLPIGATEQHGPHLGVGMDSCLAERLARAAAAETGVPCLPTLPYGCSLGHSHRWPGTLALRPQTLIEVVADLGRWLYKSGIRRLFMINGHVGNRSPLRCALELLRSECEDFKVAIMTTGTLSPRVEEVFNSDSYDWHANFAESALMLHLSPELTRPDLFKDADDPDRTVDCVFAHPVNRTSLNGVTGFPSRATQSDGEILFKNMVDDLSARVRKGLTENSPLEFNYTQQIQQ